MTQYLPAYFLSVYAPRSVDPTEATVLTPSTNAPHADPFQVCTLQGTTFKPYLGAFTGRRGRLDPLSKNVDVGELAVPVLDYALNRATGDNATRWAAAFLGTSQGQPQLMGCKLQIQESLDGGATLTPFFTGRISDYQLREDKLTWQISARDLSEDLAVPCFLGVPSTAVNALAATSGYAHVPSLLPLGLQARYGPYQVATPLSGTVVNRRTITLGGVAYALGEIALDAASKGRADNLVTDELYRLLGGAISSRWQFLSESQMQAFGLPAGPLASFNARAHVVRTTDGTGGELQVMGLSMASATVLGMTVRLPYAAGSLFVMDLMRDPSGAAPPGYLGVPTTGTAVTVYVYPAPTAFNVTQTLVIDDVHPAQLLRDLLRGHFGYLWQTGENGRPAAAAVGSPKRSVACSTAFTDLIADASWPTFRGIVQGRAQVGDWTQQRLLQVYQLGYYFDGAGNYVPVDLRRPAALPATVLTDDDLVDGAAVAWEHSRDSAFMDVQATFYEDWPLGTVAQRLAAGDWPMVQVPPIAFIPNVAGPNAGARLQPVPVGGGTFPSAAALFEQAPVAVLMFNVGRSDLSNEDLQLDAVGMRFMPGEMGPPGASGVPRDQYLLGKLQEYGLGLAQPFGAGAMTFSLPCRRTSGPTSLWPGSLALVQVSALADPSQNLRGGTRLGRCVERSEDGLTVTLKFVDLGVNVFASPPALAAPALIAGSTQHAFSDAVTENAALNPVECHVALTSQGVGAAPATSDASWHFFALAAATSGATVSVAKRNCPGAMRAWVRGRSLPGPLDPLQLPSSWVQAGSVDLAALAAPTLLASSSVSAYRARFSFATTDATLGATVSLATPSSLATLTLVQTLTPGTLNFTLASLTPNTTYYVEVRMQDAYGGLSTGLQGLSFQTPTSAVGALSAPAAYPPYIVAAGL